MSCRSTPHPATDPGRPRSLVMCPNAQHAHHPLVGKNFVDQSFVNVDAPRVGAREITDEFLEGPLSMRSIQTLV